MSLEMRQKSAQCFNVGETYVSTRRNEWWVKIERITYSAYYTSFTGVNAYGEEIKERYKHRDVLNQIIK